MSSDFRVVHYYVYAYNNTSCGGGPIYNLASPLMGSVTTALCGGPANQVIQVGPSGTYPSLTAAFADFNTTDISGPVVLELQAAYVSTSETFPIVCSFNSCISNTNTLTIRP